MARDFNGTSNYGTLTLNTAQKALTTCTFAWWEYLDSNAQYKRAYHFDAGTQDWRAEFDDGWGLAFVIPWTTATSGRAVWSITKPTTGSWHHIAITYDGGSPTNDPIIYLNGVSQAITERVSPAGTIVLPTGTGWIGAENGTGQFFDGRLAEFAIWNRVLTADEVTSLSKAFSPRTNRRGLVLHLPLIGKTSPEVELIGGSNLTLSNAPAAIEHPRIMYPR